MKTWKRLSAMATAAAVVGLATTSNGASVRYESLPKVTLSERPSDKDVPREVSAASRVPGLRSAQPKANRRYGTPGTRYVGLFVNEEDAKKYSEDKLDRWNRRPDDEHVAGASTVCFNIADHWELRQNTSEWPTQLEQWPQLRSADRGSEAAKQAPDYQKPRAFRIERLVRGDDVATLKMQEGWFDAVTLGAQQTKAYDVTFKRVATGPGEVEVYAARAADGNSVEIIVYQPLHDKNVMGTVGSHMQVIRASEHGSSDCGHARVSLRTAPGTGEHGSVQLDIVLPDEDEADKTSKPKAEAERDDHAPRKPKEIRVRSLVVHVGVSQGIEDKEPVTTVTFGWHGRERKAQVF